MSPSIFSQRSNLRSNPCNGLLAAIILFLFIASLGCQTGSIEKVSTQDKFKPVEQVCAVLEELCHHRDSNHEPFCKEGDSGEFIVWVKERLVAYGYLSAPDYTNCYSGYGCGFTTYFDCRLGGALSSFQAWNRIWADETSLAWLNTVAGQIVR